MKFKVRQFFLSFFTNTETLLVEMYRDLIALNLVAKNASSMSDPLSGVVELFNGAAEFEDKHNLTPAINLFESVDYGQHTKTVLHLKDLQNHLEALRKYNNQSVGEKLTSLNVSIGSFSGFNAFENYKLLHARPRDTKVTRRLEKIMKNHALKIISIIEYLMQI